MNETKMTTVEARLKDLEALQVDKDRVTGAEVVAARAYFKAKAEEEAMNTLDMIFKDIVDPLTELLAVSLGLPKPDKEHKA
jgi:hypothetical protein